MANERELPNLDISTYPTMQADELSLEELESIYGAIPREVLEKEVKENAELYRRKAVDAFIEAQTVGEVSTEESSLGRHK